LNPKTTKIEDGDITIDGENLQGLFVGRHKKSSPIFNNIMGRCYEAPAGGVAHIRFIVSQPDGMYLYDGNFETDKKITGTRSTLWDLAAKPTKILDDEEWVATKT
jgi:hypothetical protein